MFRSLFIKVALCLPMVLLSWPVACSAMPQTLHHDINVVLWPGEQRLSGVDTVTIKAENAASVVFGLAKTAAVHDVAVNGKSSPFTFKGGQLHVPLRADDHLSPLLVTIKYTASFADQVPDAPANTDNPWYGVVGIISEKGSFLQAGSGWYPELPGSFPTFRLAVDAPAGMLAVSAGHCLGHETKADRTLSAWQVDHPLRGLSLSAGRYLLRERKLDRINIATYFFAQDDGLSAKYLDAVAKYIGLYEQLIGPYPYEKFAVVENFFPTGYGFPSYTLLGSAVLRLPLILDTSLGHEVAHSWWGNGVFVDDRGGNWCEGLTTYVADYLYKEMASEEEARDYRLQVLRNFTTLVTPERDFPLILFQSRYDPASQAIGYGKAAMVFHMLRRKLGEKAFWGALREIYASRLFKETSWSDLQAAFEHQAGYPLRQFFDQWLTRKGAPRLTLTHTVREREGKSWVVTGQINQQEPLYELELNVAVDTTSKAWLLERFSISRETNPVRIAAPDQPTRMMVDPDYDTFRYLAPSEIPPSINSLKGSPAVTVVLSQVAGQGMEKVAGILAESLGLENFKIVPEAKFDRADLRTRDLLFIGLPPAKYLPVGLPAGVNLKKDSFTMEGRIFSSRSDAFFGVFSNSSGRFTAVFLPLSPASADEVTGKITHYGRYSYLAFSGGKNEVKGTWPVTSSPLMVRWDQ